MGLVHAPLLSGGAAVLAGIGTNAITDAGDNTLRFWSGLVFIVAGLAALAGGGAWLLRTLRRPRRWLTEVRLKLRQCAELQEMPDQLPLARARVDRLQRVGQRMIEEADALTVRRWVRLNRDDARSMGGTWLGNLLTLVAIVVGLPRIMMPPGTSRPLLYYAAILLALGVIALPFGPSFSATSAGGGCAASAPSWSARPPGPRTRCGASRRRLRHRRRR